MEHSSVPDRPDQPPKKEVRRTVIVGLGVISTAQLIFLLVSLPFMWFAGATAWQLILVVVIGGGALVGIRWLRGAISRQRVRVGTAFLALAVPLVDVVLVALLFVGFLGGSCTDEELQLSKEIQTFEAVAMSFDYEPESGACAGFFEVVASAEDVLTHYQRELEDDGWTVRIRGDTERRRSGR